MQVLPLKSHVCNHNQTLTPNFKSTSRQYKNPNSELTHLPVNTFSMMFRDDIDWIKLAEFCHNNFQDKNHVNTYCLACSDGSEAYTYAISLLEVSPTSDKFFPIIAADQDSEIIKAATSGRINLTPTDIARLDSLTHNHTYYFTNPQKPLIIRDDVGIINKLSYEPTLVLKNKIIFMQNDILNIVSNIKDNGNSIILCRNVAPYLSKGYQENLIKMLENNLKKGSLFIIGGYDNISDVLYNLINFSEHFKQVQKFVYKKI